MHETSHDERRLLVVAHGTRSPSGRATVGRILAAVAAARPTITVELAYLDVLSPTLPMKLDDRPTVVVPLLLSTGYHVQTDIPDAVAAFPATTVTPHLGPDDLLVDALSDRLGPAPDGSVALVGAGSTRTGATAELAETGRRLAVRTGRPVTVLTMSDDLGAGLQALAPPVRAATYLLAGGYFVDTLRRAAEGVATVAEPIGAHPAVVELVWRRYDGAPGKLRGGAGSCTGTAR